MPRLIVIRTLFALFASSALVLSVATVRGGDLGNQEPPKGQIEFSLLSTTIPGISGEGIAIDLGEFGEIPLNRASCVDPDSVRARQLGSSTGPIVVEWTDFVSGSGSYQSHYYLIMDSVHVGTVLMHGAVQLSGNAGAGNFGHQSVVFEMDADILARRTETFSTYWREVDDWYRYEAIDIETFRHDSPGLFRVEHRRQYKVQPGDQMSTICESQKLGRDCALNGDPLPEPGEWLDLDIPVRDADADSTPRLYECGPKG